VLWGKYKAFSLKEHTCLFIVFGSFYLIIFNTWNMIKLFYTAYLLKITMLEEMNVPKQFWFDPSIFLKEMESLYLLREAQIFFTSLVWKALFGILMILPVLLIIAYSTLLE